MDGHAYVCFFSLYIETFAKELMKGRSYGSRLWSWILPVEVGQGEGKIKSLPELYDNFAEEMVQQSRTLAVLPEQHFSTCGLAPFWETFISKNIYIMIRNSRKITVTK